MDRVEDREVMHERWTGVIKKMLGLERPAGAEGLDQPAGARHPAAKVSALVLGRVLSRIMLGLSSSPEGVARTDIVSGAMNVRPNEIASGSVQTATTLLESPGALIKSVNRPSYVTRRGQGNWYGLDDRTWGVVGVHVESDSTGVVRLHGLLSRLDGTVIERSGDAQPPPVAKDWAGTKRSLASSIADLVASLLSAAEARGEGVEAARLLGVGVVAGAHARHDGSFSFDTSDEEALVTIPVAGPVHMALGCPVVIENHANAVAIRAFYQRRFTTLDAVLVQVSDGGVGGALWSRGRIHRGGGGMAMEIGHLSVEPRPIITAEDAQTASSSGAATPTSGFAAACHCRPSAYGHVDCLATPARLRAELGVDRLDSTAREPSFDPQTYRLTSAGVAFRRAGTALGRGIAEVINIFNPSQVIVRLPVVLADAEPQSSAAQYLPALEAAVNEAYSTGPRDARGGETRFQAEAVNMATVAADGARAGTTAVLHAFIEHAQGRDGCDKVRARRGSTPKHTKQPA